MWCSSSHSVALYWPIEWNKYPMLGLGALIGVLTFKSNCLLNDLMHSPHLNGRSSLCVSKCLCRRRKKNTMSMQPHLHASSAIRLLTLISDGSLKPRPQTPHWKGRWSLCTRECFYEPKNGQIRIKRKCLTLASKKSEANSGCSPSNRSVAWIHCHIYRI